MNGTKILIIIGLVVVLGIISFINFESTGNHVNNEKSLNVGAILPLSGPAAIWGETLKNGMEIAKEDLQREGVDIVIVYEDSHAKAQEGLIAYRKLKDIDNIDVGISAFSRVSLPLVPLADQHEIPLIMTVVAAKDAPSQSDFAFRLFNNEKQYIDPHLDILSQEDDATFGLLYLNDGYGTSVAQAIQERARLQALSLLITESFEPATSDFRTQLTKIKAANPTYLLFVGAIPLEVTNAIKQSHELDLQSKFIDMSVTLSFSSARDQISELSEGLWTNAFPFTLQKTGNAFREVYIQKHDADPSFAAALGYDAIQLIAQATQGKKLSGEEISKNIISLKEFESLNGKITIKENGEINPQVYSVRIENGELVVNE